MQTVGYTIVEMAIVLTITAVVVGMSVSAGMTQLEATRISGTKNSLETVRAALLLYQKKQGRYPCPAVPATLPSAATYGEAAVSDCSGACPAGLTCTGSAVIGSVPFKTLKINPETAVDAYGRKVTYVVDKDHTPASLYASGNLKIKDAAGQEITASPVLGEAVFVLLSHGEDGGGAYMPATGQQIACIAGHADSSNCDNADAVFVDERMNNADTAANYFDDLVVWQAQENVEESEGPEYIYVTDYGNSRVQKFDGEGNYLSQFANSGTGNGQFDKSLGIAFDENGNIWITGHFDHRVQKFDGNGVYLSQFGSAGVGNGQFVNPNGIVFDGSGNFYVVDQSNHRVQKFDRNRNYLSQFGSFGVGNDQFGLPRGITIDSDGNIWVVDNGNSRVQKFTGAGVYVSQFGSAGAGNGQFNGPECVAIDESGDVWATDRGNNRVQKFNSAGVYQSQFGITSPYGIAFDRGGNVWVASTSSHRVQKFDSAGVYQSQFGSFGTGDGQFDRPHGIAIGTQ